MEEHRTKRRLLAIGVLGVMVCAGAFGVRYFHRKPIFGTWIGYAYQTIDGEQVPDRRTGEFSIYLKPDGFYEENGNSTSGDWKRSGDKITLIPVKFFGMTPEEHRKRYKKSDGSPSITIKRILEQKMKTMTVSYDHNRDRLIYDEPTLHYEFERAP